MSTRIIKRDRATVTVTTTSAVEVIQGPIAKTIHDPAKKSLTVVWTDNSCTVFKHVVGAYVSWQENVMVA